MVKAIILKHYCFSQLIITSTEIVEIIEIPQARMPTIKKHNNMRPTQQWTLEETTSQNSKDQNVPITPAGKKNSQSQQNIMLYKVTSNKSTSLPGKE